jgi:malonyl-CoA/methylmalonyl-CoA synthetase
MTMNLYSTFRTRWHGRESQPCLRDLSTGRVLTYADVDAQSARIAARLAEFGVTPGDRVAAQVEKSPEAFLLYLACLRAGAVYLPLNTAYQPAEIAYFLGDAEPRLFICDPVRVESMRDACRKSGAQPFTMDESGRGSFLDGVAQLPAHFETVVRDDADLAAILYTSGTTGRSKGAMLSHANLRANAEALSQAWGFSASDRLLHALPVYHVHGLFISLHCSLMSASEVLWLPKFEPSAVLRHLPEATVFMGVPTYYTRLLERADLTRTHADRIRLFVSGSAPLLPSTFEAFEQRTGHRILERYGMTETGINTSNPLQGDRVPGTVGLPLPGVELRVTGETGMIEVRGPNVFSGYWRQPEKTAADFTPDGFFLTGDLGHIDERGYVHISGRAKDLVITGGFNVYPKELELLLDSHPGVGESAVFGVPHPDFGEAVVAVIIAASASVKLDESALIAHTKQQVASFKVPKRIFVLDELPRNAMGKVQKNVLRERYGKTFAT